MNISKIIKQNLCYDSRKLKKNEIFFDFLTNSKVINPYFKDIIKKKPKLIVSSRSLNYDKTLVRKDIKKFYSYLIQKKYKKIPKKIFAVTGTNGKTSVANFFYQLHILNKIPCASIGTLGFFYNKKIIKNDLTTPDNLKIFNFLRNIKKKKINKVIIEASSHGLNQGRLIGLKFKGAVFTNFSQDHLDYHRSMSSYFKSKLILFKKNLHINSSIICFNDLALKLRKNKITDKKYNFILQSKKNIKLKIVSFKSKNSKTMLKINYKNKIYIVNINLIGEFQIKNLYQSIILSIISGLNIRKILKVLPKIKPIKGRLNILKNKNKIICIDYAHTPDGLEKVINTLKNHFERKINIVFGCGGNRDADKRSSMGKVANKLCNKIIVTDDNPRDEDPKIITKHITNYIKKFRIIHNRKFAIKEAIKNTDKKEILLIAGKGHENYQIFKNKKIFFSDFNEVRKNL